ncbi:MAG: nitronate monooxygenase [Burkholderiaceae bacterium]|nr:nitronate monooxygenase [Burkholderiaceae bacterium]
MNDIRHLLGTELPVIQAPMAGVQGHALAVAVCQAGGLGSLPCAMLTPAAMHAELGALAAQTDRPYNVNFFCHAPPQPDPARQAAWLAALAPCYDALGLVPPAAAAGPGRVPFSAEALQVLQTFRPPVVSFHFGLPGPALLAPIKGWGATVLASATTVAEALWLADHGADAVIAQGLEAGGHRGHFLGNGLGDDLSEQMGTLALVPQVVQALGGRLPVIAAGGIADAAGVAAAKALGAAGVQVGTAYLLCPEATTSAVHRAALQSEAARHTTLTRLFTGRPARGIVNRFIRELGPMNPAAPAFPLAAAAVAPLRERAEAQGSGDYSPLWAGQNASGCRAAPAGEITRALAAGW